MVTLIVLLLIITIPLGSVLSMNMGEMWLSKEDEMKVPSRKVSTQLV